MQNQQNQIEQLQQQINELNKKVDLLLEEAFRTKQRREEFDDLRRDLDLISKDLYHTAVKKLDEEGVNLQEEVITKLLFRLLRNIETFYELLGTLESITDLMKDLGPIVNQIGRDIIHKLADLEQKGYLKFLDEMSRLSDSVVEHHKPEDIALLAEKMGTIANVTRTALKSSLIEDTYKLLVAYQKTRESEIEPVGMFKALKELNRPEMKKSLGFLITLLKNISKEMNF